MSPSVETDPTTGDGMRSGARAWLRRGAVLAAVAGLLAAGLALTRPAAGDAGGALPAAPAPPPAGLPEGGAGSEAMPVRAATARVGELVMSVRAAGQAEAWRRTAVVAPLAGTVASVGVRDDQRVGAGATLLTLAADQYALGVEEMQVAVRDAQVRYEEATVGDGEISDPAVRAARQRAARARSGVDAALVHLRRAELDLRRTRVAAPFPARVAFLKVVPGQAVQAGDELMTLVDLDPIRVQVQVLEGEVGRVARGGRAAVAFAAFPGETFQGTVETVNPMVDGATRSARVDVRLPNPAGRILPGMYARVALDARRYGNRLLVPRSAVTERDRRQVVFVYDGRGGTGLAKWRYVATGLENDSLVEIVPGGDTDGVSPGEVVLTDGQQTLVHDAPVRLLAPPAPTRPAGRPRG
jgi:membrane fusion protein (multidrug efflux system)